MMKYSRYIIVGITLLIIGVLFYYFSSIVTYILIAWIFSLLGQPIHNFLLNKLNLKKFKIGPTLSAIFSMLIILMLFSVLFIIFVPQIIEQFSSIDYSKFGIALEEPINDFNNWIGSFGIEQNLKESTEQLDKLLNDWLKPNRIGSIFGSMITVASSLLIGLFSVLFIAFFFIKEEGLFINIILALVPNEYEERVKNSIKDITKLLTRYFTGILMQITVITLIVSVALGFLGVPNALLIAFFAALINVIPYVGPLIGAIFGVFLTISSGVDLQMDFYNQMLPLVLKVVTVFAIMQAIDVFILQPVIFSNSVNAHPLEVFIVILIGAQVAGIIGMVLAIPVYTILRVVARSFLSQFKVVQRITGNMESTDTA